MRHDRAMEVPLGGMPDFDPDGSPCVPYPDEILILGGKRWLAQDGQILSAPFGSPAEINRRTLTYWEGAAQRGGYTLAELMPSSS